MLEKPFLYGESIVLRPIIIEDAETIFVSLFDREVMRFTGTHQTFTLEQVKEYCAQILDADDRVDYAIVLKEEPTVMVGEAVLNSIDWFNYTANFRIALYGQQHFGKGLGTQATKLMLKYGFEKLKLHRIELEVYEFNSRAIHIYKKLGFVREGVKRDALYWEGEYHNAIIMSMLKSDYEKMNG